MCVWSSINNLRHTQARKKTVLKWERSNLQQFSLGLKFKMALVYRFWLQLLQASSSAGSYWGTRRSNRLGWEAILSVLTLTCSLHGIVFAFRKSTSSDLDMWRQCRHLFFMSLKALVEFMNADQSFFRNWDFELGRGRHFEHVWCVCVAGAMLYAADVAFWTGYIRLWCFSRSRRNAMVLFS